MKAKQSIFGRKASSDIGFIGFYSVCLCIRKISSSFTVFVICSKLFCKRFPRLWLKRLISAWVKMASIKNNFKRVFFLKVIREFKKVVSNFDWSWVSEATGLTVSFFWRISKKVIILSQSFSVTLLGRCVCSLTIGFSLIQKREVFPT